MGTDSGLIKLPGQRPLAQELDEMKVWTCI